MYTTSGNLPNGIPNVYNLRKSSFGKVQQTLTTSAQRLHNCVAHSAGGVLFFGKFPEVV
jgi:hypothetical protein